MMDLPLWSPSSGGTAKKRPWFVARGHGRDFDRTPVAQRYLCRTDGNVRRFASMSAAQRAADKLNAAEAAFALHERVTRWGNEDAAITATLDGWRHDD